MLIKYSEQHRSTLHFLTSLCAIIGGILTGKSIHIVDYFEFKIYNILFYLFMFVFRDKWPVLLIHSSIIHIELYVLKFNLANWANFYLFMDYDERRLICLYICGLIIFIMSIIIIIIIIRKTLSFFYKYFLCSYILYIQRKQRSHSFTLRLIRFDLLNIYSKQNKLKLNTNTDIGKNLVSWPSCMSVGIFTRTHSLLIEQNQLPG